MLFWTLASVVVWAATVPHLDWARSHGGEIFAFHFASSVAPASVAFAVAPEETCRIQRLDLAGRIVIVVLVWVVIAFPSAMLTACTLDPSCNL
jgi:hypothetical protein